MNAVFLDRDGTLIHDQANPGDPQQVKLIRGAAAAVASLRGLGFKIIVVTNQGGVAKGQYSEQDVAAVHERVNELVGQTNGASIDRFYYCPYSPNGTDEKYTQDHPWRKPQPGMLLAAADELKIDLARSWMIGDRFDDAAAGTEAGARTILLVDDVQTVQPAGEQHCRQGVKPDFVAPNLVEAVKVIVQKRAPQAMDKAPEPVRPAPRPAPAVRQETPDDDDVLRQLHQIHDELRAGRPPRKPFSYPRALAIGLQLVAAVCLLGAFYVGGSADPAAFVRWMASAIAIQLAAIAMLLFDR